MISLGRCPLLLAYYPLFLGPPALIIAPSHLLLDKEPAPPKRPAGDAVYLRRPKAAHENNYPPAAASRACLPSCPETTTVSRACLPLPPKLTAVSKACLRLQSLLPHRELAAASRDYLPPSPRACCHRLQSLLLLPDLAYHHIQSLPPSPELADTSRVC